MVKHDFSLSYLPPFIIFLDDGVLLPGRSIVQRLRFRRTAGARFGYSLTLLSGQSKPQKPLAIG